MPTRRFRAAVVAASVLAATVGSVVLATRDVGDAVTTRGVAATLRVPGHPGSAVAVPGALWVALVGDPRRPVRDRPLLRLDLATGLVEQRVDLQGEVSALSRVGGRLIASVTPVGGTRSGPRRLVALAWRSGNVLALGQTHLADSDFRLFGGPVDRVVRGGNQLWALETLPGTLLRLDSRPLILLDSIRLSPGATLGVASTGPDIWVTAGDAGEVIRISVATGAVARVHLGGFPMGIVSARGEIWFADRARGTVIRLDPRSLRPIGHPIRVGGNPSWLTVAGGSLYVSDDHTGTIARVDLSSGEKVGLPIRIAPVASQAVAPMLTSSGASVWVSDYGSNSVTRVTRSSSPGAATSNVTVSGTGNGPVNPGPQGTGVANGGVAGTGHFRITGAIGDQGTYVSYRTVRGSIAKVRTVATGDNGTITFVATIDLDREAQPPWAITSATGKYAGITGRGRLTVDNYQADPYTFVMRGIASQPPEG